MAEQFFVSEQILEHTEKELNPRLSALHALADAVDWLAYDDPLLKTSPRQLSDTETWLFMSVTSAIKNVHFSDGEYTYTSEWSDPETGSQYSFKEGVPVDDLLIWLKDQGKDEEVLDMEQAKVRIERTRLISILEDNTLSYRDIVENDEIFEARVRREAEYIAQDVRNPGDPDAQLVLAREMMERRRIFYPPLDTDDPILTSRSSLLSLVSEAMAVPDSQVASESKLRYISKESLATTIFTAFPVSVAVDLASHDSLAKAAGATAAFALSAAATSYNGRKHEGIESGEPLSKKDILKQAVAIGTLPAVANVVGPDAVLAGFHRLPAGAVERVKDVAGLYFLLKLDKMSKIIFKPIKGNIMNMAMNKIKAQAIEEGDYTPFILDPRKDSLYNATRVTKDAIDLLFNLEPHIPYLREQPDEDDDEKDQRFNEAASALIKSEFMIIDTPSHESFIRYQALHQFVRYVTTFDGVTKKHQDDVKRGIHAALDVMTELDEVALTAFHDIQNDFVLSDDEMKKFEMYRGKHEGMAYLLSLQSQRAIDDVRYERTQDAIDQIYEAASEDYPISDDQLVKYREQIEFDSFKSGVVIGSTKRTGKVVGGLVNMTVTAGESVMKSRVVRSVIKK